MVFWRFFCFTEEPDGSLLFSFGFSDKDNIIRWIASFGEEAELLEPYELRREIAAFGESIRNNYPEISERVNVTLSVQEGGTKWHRDWNL